MSCRQAEPITSPANIKYVKRCRTKGFTTEDTEDTEFNWKKSSKILCVLCVLCVLRGGAFSFGFVL
jgi:hypothetical protein